MNFIGQEVNNYQLLRLLGQGSSSDVYLARHKYHRFYVAMKIYRIQVSYKQEKRARNEIYMLSHFAHPHIIRMREYGIQGNTRFLVMDWATGGAIADLFTQNVPLSELVVYIKQVASALQYLHTMHIVHRDIKPANILIERRRNILLADFELAIDYRKCQSSIGNVAYAAPEQSQGRPCPASDQYALGVLVYQWLCGELPFRGSSSEILFQHRHTSPPPLHNKVPLLPDTVEQVILTALAKDPDLRFKDIKTFAEVLEQASQGLSYQTPSQIPEVFGTDGKW